MSEDVSDSLYPPLESIEPSTTFQPPPIVYDTPRRGRTNFFEESEDEQSLPGEPYAAPSVDLSQDKVSEDVAAANEHDSEDAFEEDVSVEQEEEEEDTPRTRSKRGGGRGRGKRGERSNGRSRGQGRGRGKNRGRGRARLSIRGLLGRGRKNDVERRPGRPKGAGRALGLARQVRKGKLPEPESNTEFAKLHADATTAYLDDRLEDALALAQQAVQMNPEIFATHSLLSSIYEQFGQADQALAALWSGAHVQNDPAVWWRVASLTEETSLGDASAVQEQMMYCYNKIVRCSSRSPALLY